MTSETKTTYQLTVTRITRGEWEENEGRNTVEGKYVVEPITKPREKKDQVFVYEVPHEPDVEQMVRVMESKRKQEQSTR